MKKAFFALFIFHVALGRPILTTHLPAKVQLEIRKAVPSNESSKIGNAVFLDEIYIFFNIFQFRLQYKLRGVRLRKSIQFNQKVTGGRAHHLEAT
jgi:hypothetical protein